MRMLCGSSAQTPGAVACKMLPSQSVILVDSTDRSHKLVAPSNARPIPQHIGEYEIEWNGRAYGFDQTDVFYATAVEK